MNYWTWQQQHALGAFQMTNVEGQTVKISRQSKGQKVTETERFSNRSKFIRDHNMHMEPVKVDQWCVRLIQNCKTLQHLTH